MLAFVLPPPVALEHRVATVEAVVEELARKSGRDLTIKAEMRDEVLYVGLGPHPADETMRLVARAASAEWIEDGGHTWLGRSPSFARRLAKADAAATARAFEERLAPLLAPGDGKPWGESDHPVARAKRYVDRLTPEAENDTQTHYARMRALQPGGRLLSRTLRTLPPAEVAALPLRWYGRYALPATGRQAPLSAADVRQYVEERRAFAAEIEDASPDTRDKVTDTLMLRDLKTPTPDAPTVNLQVRRTPTTVSATLIVRDAARRELDQEYAYVPALTLAEEGAARALSGYATWAARKPVLSPVALSAVEPRRAPPSPALSALLRDPVAHEPLAAMLSEPMDALAAATGGDAIVALPDDADGIAWTAEESLGGFADALAEFCALRMEGGVLVGPALRPTDAAFTKTRRAPLRDLFRLAAVRSPRLLDAARYAAAQNPEAGQTGFEEKVWDGAGVGAHPPSGLFDQGPRDPLRLFGDLSDAQREALLAGGSVAAGDLSPAARTDLERWIFARELALDEADVNGVSTWREMAEAIAGLAPGMRLVGIPGPAYPFVAVPDERGHPDFEDAQFLGRILGMHEQGFGLTVRPGFEAARLRPATRRDFAFALVAAPNLRGHVDFWDFDLDPAAPAVPYRELPPAYREAMAKGYGKALP